MACRVQGDDGQNRDKFVDICELNVSEGFSSSFGDGSQKDSLQGHPNGEIF